MKITLIQPVQNELYDFLHDPRPLSRQTVKRLQGEMIEQTCLLIEQAEPCDLIVTTEAVNYPGRQAQLEGMYASYVDQQPLMERFASLAKQKHSYLVAGMYAGRDGHLMNEAVVFDRGGRVIAHYDKVHLPGEEKLTITGGLEYCMVDADFGRFGVCICWDMQFPEVCRHFALNGAHLVVCPTWGWESIYAHARAYENGIWVAGAMSVPYQAPIEGIRTPSEIIAPDGSVRACASRSKAQALACEIDLQSMLELYQVRMTDRKPNTYQMLVGTNP